MSPKDAKLDAIITTDKNLQPEDYEAGSVHETKPTTWWAKALRSIELDTSGNSDTHNRWSNKDLDPVSPAERTWRTYNCLHAYSNSYDIF